MSREDEQQALTHLLGEVDRHEMQVLVDDGAVNRTLRFKRPGSSMYYFDLVTWPGHLCVGGDLEHFVFRRTHDMFDFFGHPLGYINASYWHEKLVAPRRAKTFSPELMRKLVGERVDEWLESTTEALGEQPIDLAHVLDDVSRILLDPDLHDDGEAHARLAGFRSGGLHFHDTWEWDLTDYDYHFLLSCHAIVWGINRYRETKEGAAA